jgi:flagellar assembly protein FliH
MSARVIKTDNKNPNAFSALALPQVGQNNKIINNGAGKVSTFVFPRMSQNGVIEETIFEQAEFETQASHSSPRTFENEVNANKVIERAQTEAEKIIEVAKARAEEIEREAFTRGEANGRASVSMQIDKQVSDLRGQLSRTLSELQGLKSEIESKVEREMVELAIEISKKIVQREVTVDREVALTLARVALTRLHSRSTTIIRLHPDDYAHAIAHRERLESDGTVEILEDRSVGLGGCVIQTDMGEIDARIVQQFREVEKGFWGEMPY